MEVFISGNNNFDFLTKAGDFQNKAGDFQNKADDFQNKADNFQNKADNFQSLEARKRARATGRGRGG